jgi:hypothetical protein
VNVGVETRRGRRGEAFQKGGPIAAVADVVADETRFLAVQHHQEGPALRVERLRSRGARLLVPVLAVDDRGERVLGVALHVLPDVQHRPARGVHQRAAAPEQVLEELDGRAEGRQDHHVFRGQVVERLAGIAQEADALVAQLGVDVRVVDDLAGQEDLPVGEPFPRLVGVIDGAIDPIAEAKFPGEMHRQIP